MSESPDLTNRDQAVALLESGKSKTEWDANVRQILAANGGRYPWWWYEAVVMPSMAGTPLWGNEEGS